MIRKGTYVLFLHFSEDRKIRVGALGLLDVSEGDYCYVGSAMAGLDQRLRRHLSKEKNIRWHIDYLTTVCDDISAYESYEDIVPECDLARLLTDIGCEPVFKGFGCSDCDCLTHLFRVEKEAVISALIERKLTKFVY